MLSNRLGSNIFVKREDLQEGFSYRLRGTYNKIAHLRMNPDTKVNNGVITFSAGSHGQSVAIAAKDCQVAATIVVPHRIPHERVEGLRMLGAKVISFGDDIDMAAEECRRIAEVEGKLMIEPADDPYVIAGQGTVAMEVLKQFDASHLGQLDAVFCEGGGCSLLAGVAAYVKQVSPHTKVIGVESENANAMTLSLNRGDKVKLDQVGLFVEGAAVTSVGEEPYRICNELVDDMWHVL